MYFPKVLPELYIYSVETAFHPGDDMEQFELEMYERHMKYFKEIRSTHINPWCERHRDTASKSVQRVRIYTNMHLFIRVCLLRMRAQIITIFSCILVWLLIQIFYDFIWIRTMVFYCSRLDFAVKFAKRLECVLEITVFPQGLISPRTVWLLPLCSHWTVLFLKAENGFCSVSTFPCVRDSGL